MNTHRGGKSTFIDKNVTKSVNLGTAYNSNERASHDEPNFNYMLVNDPDRNSMNNDRGYTETKPETWNDRAKKLSKDLNSYSSRENMDSARINIQEKLRHLLKNAKKDSFNDEDDKDQSYQYKKKRGSSLKRFQDPEQPNVVENTYQRRSFNNNTNMKQPFYEHRKSNNDQKHSNLLVNTILKENIKR